MSTSLRIAGFVGALVAVFALALVVGRGVGPIGTETAEDDGMNHEPTSATDTPADSADGAGGPTGVPGGLMVSAGGYTLDLGQTSASPGRAVPMSFQITGPDGAPVTAYDVEHEKELHFIVVRRDLTGFQHVQLLLDFKHGDAVRTASFALSADQNSEPGESLTPSTESGHTGH